MSYGLTTTNRHRLQKLADYLLALPPRYTDFDMSSYVDYYEENKAKDYARHNGSVSKCGTSACALGHGPAAQIFFPKELIGPKWHGDYDSVGLNWRGYSDLFIGGEHRDLLWEWLFSSEWRDVDNHHYGAAARILFILAGRQIPSDFDLTISPAPRHRRAYRDFDRRVRVKTS